MCVGKYEGTSTIEHLEYFVRKNLNKTAIRVMAVLNPIKLIIDNYDNDSYELLEATNNPEDINSDKRKFRNVQ